MLDKDIYNLPPEELAEIPSAPGSLEDALAALEEDHGFLLKGDVFTKDVIDMWIEYKIENEVNDVKLRPHPHEFYLFIKTNYSCYWIYIMILGISFPISPSLQQFIYF